MPTPKFSLRAALFTVTVVAIWLSSSVVKDVNRANSIRDVVWFIVGSIVVLSVIHTRRQERAFWIGAAWVLLTRLRIDWLSEYQMSFRFASDLARYFTRSYPNRAAAMPMHHFINQTVILVTTLALCLACGALSVSIYKAARRSKDPGKSGRNVIDSS